MLKTIATLAALPVLAAGVALAQPETAPRRLPIPAVHTADGAGPGLKTAVFSGGCFWGVQGVFSHIRGVRRAVSGYTGGVAATANYETVSTGATGHAEAVEVTYDPRTVSYGQLLQAFFSVALDPTEVGRQGPDEGPQYRSVLWTSDPGQAVEARAYLAELDHDHAFARPIATAVQPLRGFWPAEGYHQDFMALHPGAPYIQAWDVGRVAALKALFPGEYRAEPVVSAPGRA